MDKVLIVDDDLEFLNILKKDLEKYDAQFEVLTAPDGAEAIEVLRKEPVSVLVTDLVMPNVDGLELLGHMIKNHPTTLCIVMTESGSPQIKKEVNQSDILRYIEKPFDFKELGLEIIEGLDRRDEDGFLRRGVSLGSFLQLIEIKEKTCLLEVHCGKKGKGLFYFNKGVLYDAICNDLKGEAAVIKMIRWDNVGIDFKSAPSKKIAKRIKTELASLIMEAARLKDESSVEGEKDPHEMVVEIEEIVNSLLPEEETTGPEKAEEGPDLKTKKEELFMALEGIIKELAGISGCLAAGIMNFTGEVLASESNDQNIDLNLMGATFNDIFREAHGACKKIGLEACREAIIQTPNGTIVMRCSGADEEPHLHAIAILSTDGNYALMKMIMAKVLPKAKSELE